MTDPKKTLNKWFYILLIAVPVGLILLRLKPVFIMGWCGFFLLIAIVLFVHAGDANKKARGYLTFASAACIVLTLLYSKDYKQEKGNNENLKKPGQTENIGNSVDIPEGTQKIGPWTEIVEITGKEYEGKAVRVPKADWYDITYLGNKIYDKPEDEAVYDIWGTGYDREWKQYFTYSHVPGVKALEALMIVDGEVGSENGKVCQFPDGKGIVRIWVEKYVRFFRHEAFKPDINGNIYWCFQNNYGSWNFQIKKIE